MGELLYLTIEELVLLVVALGTALIAALSAKSFTGWLGEAFNVLLVPIKVAVRLAEYVAHFMKPAYDSVEKRVTGWFAGHGQAYKYNIDHAYRNSYAIGNVTRWVNVPVRGQILAKALNQAEAANLKNALTKAPTLPQKRITQREVDIEFQKIIEKEFVQKLKQDFPKFDWDPNRWKKWLGVLPALGGAVVGPPKTTPTPVPAPKPAPVKTTVPIAPPIPTTLPHTDDQPHPEPGTQIIPGVISAKDKVARGQIQTLKRVTTDRQKHLGPLAFLAIPAIGISTLVGLLECRNFSRFLNPFCAMPTNLLTDLLALITDFFILTDICEVITIVDDVFGDFAGALADITGDVVGALCNGKFPAHEWGGLLYSTAAPELNTLAL